MYQVWEGSVCAKISKYVAGRHLREWPNSVELEALGSLCIHLPSLCKSLFSSFFLFFFLLPNSLLQLGFDLDREVYPMVVLAVVDEGDGKQCSSV